MVPINYLAVLVGAVSNMIIGSLWFGPLFGKQWMAASGMGPQQIDAAKAKGMGKSYAIMFAGALLMSYVLAHALIFAVTYLGSSGAIYDGLMVGFVNWLGFIAPVTVGAVLWENKSWKLWCINSGYYLVSLMVMGIILAMWM